MMDFRGKDLANEFAAAFGIPIEDVTPAQMKWLVKFGKHVRGRCRSNAALKNYLSQNFPGLRFTEVERQAGTLGAPRHYKALEITSKKRPEDTAVDDGDE